MKISPFEAALLLLPLLGTVPAWAKTADSCWPAVINQPNTTVSLTVNAQDQKSDHRSQTPELFYLSNVETPLQDISRKTLTAAKAGDTVRLGANAGQIILRRGPLLMERSGLLQLIPAPEPYDKEIEIRFAAPAGTRVRVDTDIPDGKLPANTLAPVIVDSSEPLTTTLVTPAEALPMPPPHESGWLDAGALPITRGGRMLSVDVYAPGLTSNMLKGETFLACLGESPASTAIASATDGKATVLVHVPEQVFTGTAFWNSVRLKILGTSTALFPTPINIFIGNPYIAFVISIVITIFILFGLAWLVEHRTDTKPVDSWTLPRLFVGVDGEPSLSLFQMYIWTGLVIAGMIYVFCMSGNLLGISQEVLILLGLAGLSSVGARLVSTTAAASPPAAKPGFWGMFIVNGKPDLLRLQVFLFTVVIWLYVAARIYYEQSFPKLGIEVLTLMGISNGIYVGAKWAATGDSLAELKRLKLEQDTYQDGLTVAQEELNRATANNDAAVTQTAQEKVNNLTRQRDAAKAAYEKELDRLSKT